MKWMRWWIVGAMCGLALCSGVNASTFPGRWLLVDTQAHELSVMEGEEPIWTFNRIAIGRGGVTPSKLTRDHKTPLGEFHITEIRKSDLFHVFMELNYPNTEHAKAARDADHISEEDYWAIQRAAWKGLMPPQNTRLGGHIGIHGVGRGDLHIHQQFDWTQGCIALTNQQIEQLQALIGTGARVVIR